MIKSSRRIFLAALAAALTAGVTHAADFAAPSTEVLLTITGEIAARNVDGALELDQQQLAGLAQSGFSTSTTWTSGKPTFQGVLLKDLIAAIGASGTTINLKAANDYTISIPLADVKDDAPLLAYMMDGKTMSLRDKGPIWLVYPYDNVEAYRTEETYSRSIWQLTEIEFVK